MKFVNELKLQTKDIFKSDVKVLKINYVQKTA